MLSADNAAVASRTQKGLQMLINTYFFHAFKDFGLITTSFRKTNVLGQDSLAPPNIALDNYKLNFIEEFTYLDFIITENFSLDSEICKRIGKTATTMARLTNCV